MTPLPPTAHRSSAPPNRQLLTPQQLRSQLGGGTLSPTTTNRHQQPPRPHPGSPAAIAPRRVPSAAADHGNRKLGSRVGISGSDGNSNSTSIRARASMANGSSQRHPGGVSGALTHNPPPQPQLLTHQNPTHYSNHYYQQQQQQHQQQGLNGQLREPLSPPRNVGLSESKVPLKRDGGRFEAFLRLQVRCIRQIVMSCHCYGLLGYILCVCACVA